MSVVLKSDDNTVTPGTIFYQWGEVSLQAGDAFGKSLRTIDEAKQNIINAGFVEVKEHRFKWPIGGMMQPTGSSYSTNNVLQAGPGIHGSNRLVCTIGYSGKRELKAGAYFC